MSQKRTASYAFVSYAHDNGGVVLPVIELIADKGFSVWYDKSINLSSTWTDEVARAILECDIVVAFISKESVASKYARSEIEFALNKGKPIIPVYLDGIETLPPGLALALNATQGVVGKKDAAEIANQICAGLEFNALRRENKAIERDGGKRRVWSPLKIAASVSALALIAVAYLLFRGESYGAYEITLDKKIYLPAEPMGAKVSEITREMIDSRAIVGVWDKGENDIAKYRSYGFIDDPNLRLRAPSDAGDYEARTYESPKANPSLQRSAAAFSVAKSSMGVFEVSIDANEYEPKAPISVSVRGASAKMIADNAIVGVYEAGAPPSEFWQYVIIKSALFKVDLDAPEEIGEYEIRAYTNNDIKSAETLVAVVKFSVVDQ
ncbi:MAG: toll/interleukin-1 receptor domain-containing protein [Helicobacteraceae bacterium]|jgi:hypothetical protein|nr:toll/interleukin-1 receptor domain-containing protein [Helicobacteraceae bacterium]